MSDDLIERLAATEGYTSGPWEACACGDSDYLDEVFSRSSDEEHWDKPIVSMLTYRKSDDETDANANLIALAPEMRARILADAAVTAALRAEVLRLREALTQIAEGGYAAAKDALLLQGEAVDIARAALNPEKS